MREWGALMTCGDGWEGPLAYAAKSALELARDIAIHAGRRIADIENSIGVGRLRSTDR